MADEAEEAENLNRRNIRYIEESLRLLQRAREEALRSSSHTPTPTSSYSSSTTTSSSHRPSPSPTNDSTPRTNLHSDVSSNRSAQINTDFRQAFPGLSGNSSGRHLQTYLPSNKHGKKSNTEQRYNPYQPKRSFTPANTWTHDFVCLALVDMPCTPSNRELGILRAGGLGRKKVVHLHIKQTLEGYFPRLKSQNGVRSLEKLSCSSSGYSVVGLKEEVRSSVVYIVPLNSEIDTSPISVNEVSSQKDTTELLCVCTNCDSQILLFEFQEHKAICSSSDLQLKETIFPSQDNTSSDNKLGALQAIFPDHDVDLLEDAIKNSATVQDAVEKLLTTEKVAVVAGSSKDMDEEENFETLASLIEFIRNNKLDMTTETKLEVKREEFWRQGLTFYKKAINKPDMLKKKFEVQFTCDSGEENSVDAGAIKVEFFELMLEELNKRLMEGGEKCRMPRRGDNFNCYILGIVIAHSIINDGPGFYVFHPWVYEHLVNGAESLFDCMPVIKKEDVPLNAATNDLITFLGEIDSSETEDELSGTLDKHIQIVNSSLWDPLKEIRLNNKYFLSAQLIHEEVVTKRIQNVKSIRDGLKFLGLLEYIQKFKNLFTDVFLYSEKVMDSETFLSFIEESSETEYEKTLTLGFFKTFVQESNHEILKKILRFVTGFSDVPPWGLKRKLKINFLVDDDTKIYPEAMACFHILYLPTVHSNKDVFIEHFLKALDIEGTGFSASF